MLAAAFGTEGHTVLSLEGLAGVEVGFLQLLVSLDVCLVTLFESFATCEQAFEKDVAALAVQVAWLSHALDANKLSSNDLQRVHLISPSF